MARTKTLDDALRWAMRATAGALLVLTLGCDEQPVCDDQDFLGCEGRVCCVDNGQDCWVTDAAGSVRFDCQADDCGFAIAAYVCDTCKDCIQD